LGYAEDQTIQLPGGNNAVKAQYAGDNSFNASSTSTTYNITKAPTTIQPVVNGFVVVGQPTNLVTVVQAQSSGAAPTGTVTFSVNGSPLTGTLSLQGISGSFNNVALLNVDFSNVTFNTVGQVTVTASYSGDGNYAPSSSTTIVTVTGIAIASLQATPINPQPGSPVTLTALIDTSVTSPTPSGVVNFFNSTNIFTGQINGSVTYSQIRDAEGNAELQASITFVPTTFTTVVSASYNGTDFTANQPNTVTITIAGSDFQILFPQPSITIQPGEGAFVGFFIYGEANYTGTVNFTSVSCSGIPQLSTCTIGPASITGNGSGTVVISTKGPSPRSAAGHGLLGWAVTSPFALGCLLVFPPRLRRRFSTKLLLPLLGILLVLPSCGGGSGSAGGGGGSGNPGTPVGSYTITVNATSTTGTSHNGTFTLIVQ
jgi:hypothetical protein